MKKSILLILLTPLAVFSQINNGQHTTNHKQFVQNNMNYEFKGKHFEKEYSLLEKLKSKGNTNYLPDSIYNYFFNSLSDSILNLRTYFTYDSVGNKTNELSYKWNDTANFWFQNYEYDFTYDSIGNNTEEIQFDTTNNIFHSNIRYEFKYDTADRLTSRTEFAYLSNGNSHKWLPAFKDVYTYDFIGNKISDLYYFTGNNWVWVPYHKFVFVYDSNRNITLETDSIRDIININGTDLTNQWNWYGNYKYDYAYNSTGNDTLLLYYYWNYITKQWIEDYKAEYNYDPNGRLTSQANYLLDTTTNQLIKSGKAEYSYDSKGYLFSESKYIWNIAENQWNKNNKKYYFYSIMHDLAIKNKPQLSGTPFKLFPNPAKEKVSLEIYDKSVNRAILYNTNGQLIKVFFIQQGLNILNLNQLSKGHYIIQMPLEKGICIQKMIKE